MYRRTTAAATLALLVLLAGCTSFVDPTPTDRSPSGATAALAPTVSSVQAGTTDAGIHVSTTASVEAAPDLAVLSLAVEATAADADAARERVVRDVERMRAALRDAGVPDDAVTTTAYNIYPQYDYTDRERELVGYRAVHAFRVELADVDRAGEVIDAAVGAGATRVNGVQFTLADETRQDLRARALAAAMDRARADADAVADAAGLSVTGVRSVSTGDAGGPVYPYALEREGGDGGASAPTVLEPGQVTVTASVSVTYGFADSDE